jgi:hypothetical protein
MAVLSLLALLFPVCLAADAGKKRPTARQEPIRGITISTHTDGRDWAHDRMVATLEEIKELGANWVTIHPYAGISGDGAVRFRPIDPANPPEHVARPIREAHALGLKILIKPHLAYWGSPFRWRGEIAFDDEEQWRRFWSDYERWIVSLAEAAGGADGFVVGTELDLTLGHEQAWRRIIARVRERTSAPLTYAANWTGYESVTFWDALDAIGIQAYFPLTQEGEAVTEEAIRKGWMGWMERLRAFSEAQDRAIVFTELGYNRSRLAPVRPWDSRTDGDEALPIQEACLRSALLAIDDEPSVLGAFLWKWFPQPRSVGRNFQLATPRMKHVIREAWKGDRGAELNGDLRAVLFALTAVAPQRQTSLDHQPDGDQRDAAADDQQQRLLPDEEVAQLDRHRRQCADHHEQHRHHVGQAAPSPLDQVERNDQQRQTGQQLVDRAEELPECQTRGLAVDLVEGEKGDAGHRDRGREITIGQR